MWWGVKGAKPRGSLLLLNPRTLGYNSSSEVFPASSGSGVPIVNRHFLGAASPRGDFGPHQLALGQSQNSLGGKEPSRPFPCPPFQRAGTFFTVPHCIQAGLGHLQGFGSHILHVLAGTWGDAVPVCVYLLFLPVLMM